MVPFLATEWKQVSPLERDFSIREGVKFQDGADLTAEAAAASLNSVLMILSQRNRLIDIADPIGFLTADYTCKGTYNLSHFCNDEHDAVITEAAGTYNTEERYKLYSRAGQLLDDQAVNLWPVNEQAADAIRSNVLSYVQDPLSRNVVTAQTAKSGS